ncbi:MAG: DUF47 family protein [Candidatus Freyarchaeota archaeon]|nr:DUF47 family protein [Candidatus Jordarchaeia archaeon]
MFNIDGNRERAIFDIMQEHIRVITSAVREFELSLDDWMQGNVKLVEERLEKISNYAKEADKIKRSIIDELSLAASLLQREDFMRFALIVDKIADYTEGMCFRLSGIRNWKPRGVVAEDIRNMVSTFTHAVEKLREAVNILSEDAERALSAILEVDSAERFADQIHRTIEQSLFELNVDHRTLIRLLNLISHIEDAVDVTQEAAEALRIIAIIRIG